MIELAPEDRSNTLTRIGTQPVALAAATLLVILASFAVVALWRASAGTSPELERAAAATRGLQARATQASEQLVEKTKGLQITQQESIDQLQVVQDQLQQVRKMLAAQQADTKRLSDQVSSLTEAIEGLRQSFASTQTAEPSNRAARGARKSRE
jgi:septal ring factor EnvC (AmiA/AmiB activator)